MDILNTIPKPPQFDGDPDEVALNLLGKLFPSIPSYESFQTTTIIYKSDLSDEDKKIAFHLSTNIDNILKKDGYAEIPRSMNLMLQLTSLGRAAKNAGGLTAYITQLKQSFSPSITNIHQGDNYGNIVQSGHQSSHSLSQDNSLDKQGATNINPTKPSKRSLLERLSWVIGILVGLLALYEFVIKKFFLK